MEKFSKWNSIIEKATNIEQSVIILYNFSNGGKSLRNFKYWYLFTLKMAVSSLLYVTLHTVMQMEPTKIAL